VSCCGAWRFYVILPAKCSSEINEIFYFCCISFSVFFSFKEAVALTSMKIVITCSPIASPSEPDKQYRCEEKQYLFGNNQWNDFMTLMYDSASDVSGTKYKNFM
jgi:hypothetical protein